MDQGGGAAATKPSHCIGAWQICIPDRDFRESDQG